MAIRSALRPNLLLKLEIHTSKYDYVSCMKKCLYSAAGQLVLILSGLAFMVFMVFLSLVDILYVLLGT